MKLLVAEDNQKLLKTLLHIFESNKFIVDGVDNGKDAYIYAQTGEYDGLVLDIMMPGMDGIEVLKKLRREGISTPTLFLTAKTEIEDKVNGLDSGADDYLPKPFNTQELLARVRAILRRKDVYTPDILEYNHILLNRSTYQLCYKERSIALSGKEFQLMEMFMQRPGVITSTEQCMTHVWGWDTNVDTSVVWVHVSNLRKKMDQLKAPAEIRFVRGAGYLIEEKNDI